MATTEITQSIKDITGISSLSSHSIEDAQRFVVSSIPKDLLTFAQTASSASTDGSAISFETNDSIIDVQRNGYSCIEIPMSESIWALDSTSLKYATAKHPVWYHKLGSVHFAPVTDGSNAGYVYYVDSSKIDDDSDLRNAVIFYACSAEFTKLANSKITDWSELVAPVSPSSPSFTYTDASVNDVIKPIISISDMASMTESAPSYIKPVFSLTDFPTITWSYPSLPVVPTFSAQTVDDFSNAAPTYSAPVLSLEDAPTISDLSLTAVSPSTPNLSSNSVSFSQAAPSYTQPIAPSRTAFNDYWTLSDFGDSDPGSLTINAIAPVPPSSRSFTTPAIDAVTVGTMPDIASTTISNVGTPPTYTAPAITTTGSDNTSVDLTKLDTASWTALDYDFDDENIDPLKWFQVLGDMIQNQEDIELANAQMQKIQTYVGAYTQAMQNKLNEFNDANVEYQAKLQESIQQAQINAQKALQQAQIDKEKVVTDAQIEAQEKQQEASLKLQQENQEYAAELQKYSAEVSSYQADVNKEIQEYTQNFQRYQVELNTVYTAWAKTESDKLQEYQASIQNQQAVFNKENAEYQAQLQISIQNAQLSSQDDAQLLTKYSSDLQSYQAKVNAEIQEYQQNLSGDLQVWNQERQTDLQKYSSDMQNALNTFNKENVIYQATVQEKIQEAQLKDSNEARNLQKYQNQIQSYQSELNKVVNGNQAEIAEWQQRNAMSLQKYQADVQNELNSFNKDNVVYQQDIQRKIQNLQKDTQEAVQNAQNEISVNNNNLQKDVQIALQNALQDFQQDVQEYKSDLELYVSKIQKYSAQINEKAQNIASSTQNATFLSNESKKYYEWSKLEISSYIQNNSKMIQQTMAAQQQAAQQK
tara:strand:+ start:532 stop:3144 length:2613 start_codon:yes stop_codon:yes gene_type:complete